MMLIIVVFLFAVCWGPILINNVFVAFGIINDLHTDFLKPMRTAFLLMSYANSCINPIVYGFMSKNFRDTFKHYLNIFVCLQYPVKMIMFLLCSNTIGISYTYFICSIVTMK
jgi:hypothetical protein